MPYGRKTSSDPMDGGPLDPFAIASAAIGAVAANFALFVDASVVEALLTYIAAAGTAHAIMPYLRK